MEMDAIRLTKTTFVDSAYEAILTHQLRPGERLRSKEFAKSLSISRTPVERALERLAGEGLVEFKPGQGPFVFQPSVDEVLDLSNLRMVLELFGVSYAAAAGPNEEFIASLEQTNQRFELESSRGDGDFVRYIRPSHADKDFHGVCLSGRHVFLPLVEREWFILARIDRLKRDIVAGPLLEDVILRCPQ